MASTAVALGYARASTDSSSVSKGAVLDREIGDFVLIEEIGRGGMGVVYKARQKSLGRVVALKVLPSFTAVDPSSVVRFRREAAAAGGLNHPGIVPVHAVGIADGTHYFAMELIDGPPLDSMLDRVRGHRPSTLRQALPVAAELEGAFPELLEAVRSSVAGNDYVASCAAIAARLANALGAAHQAGVTHRDVKPSNILLHSLGRPVLVDFGLARNEGAMQLTRTGNMVGTPAYAAPEQIAGSREADARVDVYGLGAVLYEMLALRPPFEGGSVAELLQKVETESPVPLRHWNRCVPADLDRVVRRCLEKDPDDRYPCIEALEEDLRCFLAGRAVLARRPTLPRRAASALRRHRRVSIAFCAALLAASCLFAWVGWVSSTRSRDEGMTVLEQARRSLLEEANVARAGELYGRAGELLDDPGAVRRARRAHAEEAFERLYPDHLDVLQTLMRSLPVEERADFRHVAERLDGRGTLVLRSLQEAFGPTVSARVRALRDGDLQPWRALEPGVPLPLGEHQIEVCGPDGRVASACVEIRRDRELDLPPELLAVEPPPAGFVQVADSTGESSFAAAARELTRGEYRRWLDSLDDRELAAEMMPKERLDGDPELPVGGLSYAQARAVAAHLGAHLPTLQEYLAAVSGGLSGLERPWGNAFDGSKLVADAKRRDDPVSVDRLADSASPLGLLHAFGNVAEILAPGPDGAFSMAGGHFHEVDPTRLRLTDPPSLVAPLPGRTGQSRYAGLRLARFLEPLEEPAAAQEVETALAELMDRHAAAMIHDWVVRSDGQVDYRVRLAGFQAAREGEVRLEVATPGFAQLHEVAVRGGHGGVLGARRATAGNGEASALNVQLPEGPPGQRYVFSVETRLTPAGGLRGELDGYDLVLPLATTGVHDQIHRVRLPRGCRIVRAEPDPWRLFRTPSGTHVVWRAAADGRARFAPGRIHFRLDGKLTERWPVERAMASAALEFLTALEASDFPTLHRLVHPAYEQSPGAFGRDDVLRSGAIPVARYSGPRLLDVTAVGSTVTLDLLADWSLISRSGPEAVLRGMPFRLELLRGDAGLRVLRFEPRTGVDRGVLEHGSYRNEALGVTVRPPDDAIVHRMMDGLTDMQIVVSRDQDPGLRVQVSGHYAGEDEDLDAVRMRLSTGDRELLWARSVASGESSPAGDRIKQTGQGTWTSERWQFETRGRRHFLIRTAAQGRDREQAVRRHDDGEAWFASVLRSLALD